MKKRLLTVILAVTMVLSTTACGKTETNVPDAGAAVSVESSVDGADESSSIVEESSAAVEEKAPEEYLPDTISIAYEDALIKATCTTPIGTQMVDMEMLMGVDSQNDREYVKMSFPNAFKFITYRDGHDEYSMCDFTDLINTMFENEEMWDDEDAEAVANEKGIPVEEVTVEDIKAYYAADLSAVGYEYKEDTESVINAESAIDNEYVNEDSFNELENSYDKSKLEVTDSDKDTVTAKMKMNVEDMKDVDVFFTFSKKDSSLVKISYTMQEEESNQDITVVMEFLPFDESELDIAWTTKDTDKKSEDVAMAMFSGLMYYAFSNMDPDAMSFGDDDWEFSGDDFDWEFSEGDIEME